jgi:hypothetical protein
MQPNDLPLIEFLYSLTEAFESHYAGHLLRYARRHEPASSPRDGKTPIRRFGLPPVTRSK